MVVFAEMENNPLKNKWALTWADEAIAGGHKNPDLEAQHG